MITNLILISVYHVFLFVKIGILMVCNSLPSSFTVNINISNFNIFFLDNNTLKKVGIVSICEKKIFLIFNIIN